MPQDWAEQWQQWHTLSATKSDQFNEDLLYRPTTRVLDGAEAMCDTLQNVREDREPS